MCTEMKLPVRCPRKGLVIYAFDPMRLGLKHPPNLPARTREMNPTSLPPPGVLSC